MNKNQRIAERLQWMATNFRNLAVTMEDTMKILLEKESLPATKPTGNNEQRSEPHTFSKATTATLPHNNLVLQNYIDLARKRVDNNTTVSSLDVNSLDALVYGGLVRKIGENSTTVFYKRTQGTGTGSVISLNKKSKKVKDHQFTIGSDRLPFQLCLVSKDNDGIAYVNNVVRPELRKHISGTPKIARYYRNGKPYTHTAVYLG